MKLNVGLRKWHFSAQRVPLQTGVVHHAIIVIISLSDAHTRKDSEIIGDIVPSSREQISVQLRTLLTIDREYTVNDRTVDKLLIAGRRFSFSVVDDLAPTEFQ